MIRLLHPLMSSVWTFTYIYYKEVGGLQPAMTTTKLPLVGWLKFFNWIELNWEEEDVHINLQTERPAISTATPSKPQTPEMTTRHVFSFSFSWGLLVLLTGTPFLRTLSLHPVWRPWFGLMPSSTPKHTANHTHPPTPPHPHHHPFHHSFVLPTPCLCQWYLFLLLAFPLQLALKQVKSWQLT